MNVSMKEVYMYDMYACMYTCTQSQRGIYVRYICMHCVCSIFVSVNTFINKVRYTIYIHTYGTFAQQLLHTLRTIPALGIKSL